jgi:hypothetical protein
MLRLRLTIQLLQLLILQAKSFHGLLQEKRILKDPVSHLLSLPLLQQKMLPILQKLSD